MHMLIVLSTLAMFSSSLGFWLDIVGPTKYSFKFIRKNALPSVATGNIFINQTISKFSLPIIIFYKHQSYIEVVEILMKIIGRAV